MPLERPAASAARAEDAGGGRDCSAWIEPARAAVARVAVRFRLSRADAQDLHGDLWVRLLAKDGLVLRQYRQAALIETYLTSVATNLAIDLLRRTHGKWRPTLRARQLGTAAVALEALIVRDGLPPEAALAQLRATRPDAAAEPLARFAQSIVPRPRRRAVTAETLSSRPSPDPGPDRILEHLERSRAATALAGALSDAITALPHDDRDLVLWRYAEKRTVASLAATLRTDQKALYRRFDHIARRLEAHLGEAGFESSVVAALLSAGCDINCAGLTAPRKAAAAAPLRRYFRLVEAAGDLPAEAIA